MSSETNHKEESGNHTQKKSKPTPEQVSEMAQRLGISKDAVESLIRREGISSFVFEGF